MQTEIEVMNPMYSDGSLPTPKMFRFNQKDNRYYFNLIDGEVCFYPSVTNIIGKTTPMSYGLQSILGNLGMDGYRQFMNEKAQYGTMLHIIIANYLKSANQPENRNFDFETLNSNIEEYKLENNITFNTDFWELNLKKDLLSLIQFVIDYKVKPIFIEGIGYYKEGDYKFAGALDLLCKMTIKEKGFFGEVYKSGEKKGEPKESYKEFEVTAIVDFKSGKSGFFESHEIQLNMYKMIAESTFNIKVDKCYNVAPKEWTSTPTYTIKDQTGSSAKAKIPYLLALYNIDFEDPKSVLLIDNKINGTNINNVCKYIPAKEYVLRKLGLLNNNISDKIVPEKEFELELY